MSTATVTVEGDFKRVLLPPEVRLAEGAVDVQQVGDSVILAPKSASAAKRANAWKLFEEAIGKVTDDFMVERVQPPQADREPMFE